MSDATAHISEKVQDTMRRHNCATLLELCDKMDGYDAQIEYWCSRATDNAARAASYEHALRKLTDAVEAHAAAHAYAVALLTPQPDEVAP